MRRAGIHVREIAKREAVKCVDNMGDDARAMVIAFCDQATVVSSFDNDRESLKRKIATIQQTESTTGMAEAISLAEAFAQLRTVEIRTVRGQPAKEFDRLRRSLDRAVRSHSGQH